MHLVHRLQYWHMVGTIRPILKEISAVFCTPVLVGHILVQSQVVGEDVPLLGENVTAWQYCKCPPTLTDPWHRLNLSLKPVLPFVIEIITFMCLWNRIAAEPAGFQVLVGFYGRNIFFTVVIRNLRAQLRKIWLRTLISLSACLNP